MKFIWEPKDFSSESGNWGLMAKNGDEIVIIGGLSVTSLRDGHHWEYESEAAISDDFNSAGYEPILSPVNPSVLIKKAQEKQFGYGA